MMMERFRASHGWVVRRALRRLRGCSSRLLLRRRRHVHHRGGRRRRLLTARDENARSDARRGHPSLHGWRSRSGHDARVHHSTGSVRIAVLNLYLLLRLHARAHRGVRKVGDAVDDISQLFNVWVLTDDGDASQARRELLRDEHETDETVVALRVHHALLVLNHEARRDDGVWKATANLARQAQLGIGAFATLTRDTRHAVAARVLGGPRRTHLQDSLRVRRAARTKQRVATVPRTGARGVTQTRLPLIVVLLPRRRLVAFLLAQRSLQPRLLMRRRVHRDHKLKLARSKQRSNERTVERTIRG